MKRALIFLCIAFCSLISACTSTKINQSSQWQAFDSHAKWGIMPFTNYTQTPQAGEKAASIMAGLLRSRNIQHVTVYQRPGSCKTILACPHKELTNTQVRLWAKKRKISYVMLGSVNEWRYKVGLDGEPAVNVTANLLDATTGKIIWNSVGSKVGGSRGSVGVIAHDLLSDMLSGLALHSQE